MLFFVNYLWKENHISFFSQGFKLLSSTFIPSFQAHIPAYIVGWLTALINPVIYVCLNPTYREAARRKLAWTADKIADV